MLKLLQPYILTFIPIFVAVDSLGNIPIFVSLTSGLNIKQKKRVIIESIVTATVIAFVFMFIGKFILRIMGVTVSDFKVAGGILLLVISINLLLLGKRTGSMFSSLKDVGIFPLGTPLITGPAVLTTTLMMVDSFGLIPTFWSVLLNMIIAWLFLKYADTFIRLMGDAAIRAFSKVAYILLASIAVMMIRKGITEVFLP